MLLSLAHPRPLPSPALPGAIKCRAATRLDTCVAAHLCFNATDIINKNVVTDSRNSFCIDRHVPRNWGGVEVLCVTPSTPAWSSVGDWPGRVSRGFG